MSINLAEVKNITRIILISNDITNVLFYHKVINVELNEIPVDAFSEVENAINFLCHFDNHGNFLIFLDNDNLDKSWNEFFEKYCDFHVKSIVVLLTSTINSNKLNFMNVYDEVIDLVVKPLSSLYLDRKFNFQLKSI